MCLICNIFLFEKCTRAVLKNEDTMSTLLIEMLCEKNILLYGGGVGFWMGTAPSRHCDSLCTSIFQMHETSIAINLQIIKLYYIKTHSLQRFVAPPT